MRQAGEEAGLTLNELRDLARAIHPGDPTNRGLPAAFRGLDTRAAVPVEVLPTPDERLSDPVEAAAYFAVSGRLTNIGKYAAREGHRLRDRRRRPAHRQRLGMQGLADRVGALNGSLEVDSPAGGGTRVTAVIPLTATARPEEHELSSVPRVLSAADAEAIQRRNVRNLSFRLASLGIVTGVLVVVGPYLPWIVGPLLGLD